MRLLSLSLFLILLLPCFASESRILRVCSDPNNMPFSNRQGQGFENRIASLVASRLGEQLEYTWWAERKSFVKNSLGEGLCDVVIGIPSALDSAEVTRPYYRSSYVFLARRDRNLHVSSLLDPRLSNWKIGMQIVGEDYAPPAFLLAQRGITQSIVGFSLFGEYGELNPAHKIVDAVDQGEIDVAIVWGPLAGYFAKSARNPMDIVPVSPAAFRGAPFTYGISMGVRKGDDALKGRLDQVIESESAAIQQILTQYGVPQVQ
jgi:mxaJ protein